MISVVIAVYNGQDYIERSLRSVLEQSKFNLIKEIILIDDGSTDKTVDIAKKIYRDIVVIKKKNGGCESAKNLGIEYSKSDLFVFWMLMIFGTKIKLKFKYKTIKIIQILTFLFAIHTQFQEKKILALDLIKKKFFVTKKLLLERLHLIIILSLRADIVFIHLVH